MRVSTVGYSRRLATILSQSWEARCRVPVTRHISTCLQHRQAESQEQTPSGKVWKDRAETVIIGGGIMGTSVAYHLVKAGQKDVVLLEKLTLTSGSTWHAAGLTTTYHTSPNIKKIHHYSLQLYESLEAETGQAVGYHKCGSVRLAKSKERVEEFQLQLTKQHWNPALMRIIGIDEILELCPFINTSKILAGLYTPDDGHIDPYSLTMALAIGARRYGATIAEQAKVTATTLREDGTWDITTSRGNIRANRVVNAAGFHGREIGQLAGLDLPMCPIDHQYMVSTSIPEVEQLEKEIPVFRDLDGSYYLRQERQGLLWGPYEFPEKMRVVSDWYREVPPDFGQELYEPDLDRIQYNNECAMEMFPVLQQAQIARTVSGPITYTPDVTAMVGPYQGLANYWLAVGTGYGIAHGGGVGKYLSDYILTGQPPYHLHEFEPNRFAKWADERFVVDKVRETYGMNNALTWPHEERFAARPTTRNHKLYPRLKEHGAHFALHAGWEQPNWFALEGDNDSYTPSFRRTNWFEPVRREVEMVMNKAGVIDLTPFGKMEVSGPDAAPFLDTICANEVPKVGKSNISHMLTEDGRVLAELTVTQMHPGSFLCVTGSGSEYHDLRWMETKAKEWGMNVSITNTTEDWGVLGIAGPVSRDVMRQLTTDDVSNEEWPFLSYKETQLGSVPVRALRISYTGELGWEIYCPIDEICTVYESLLHAGKDLGVGDFGGFAMNSMRIEKGFRAWGAEMTLNNNPLEAGLGFFVKLNKKVNFVGKEALQEIKKKGLSKKLVHLNVEVTDVDPMGDVTVWSGDKVVGMTTSGAYSYNTHVGISMAYLPLELAKEGTKLDVELLGVRCPAVVQKRPPLLIESLRK